MQNCRKRAKFGLCGIKKIDSRCEGRTKSRVSPYEQEAKKPAETSDFESEIYSGVVVSGPAFLWPFGTNFGQLAAASKKKWRTIIRQTNSQFGIDTSPLEPGKTVVSKKRNGAILNRRNEKWPKTSKIWTWGNKKNRHRCEGRTKSRDFTMTSGDTITDGEIRFRIGAIIRGAGGRDLRFSGRFGTIFGRLAAASKEKWSYDSPNQFAIRT